MTSFSGFRRREARAVNSGNLAWKDTAPTDVDYIAARGMSGSPLGALLEGLKWAHDHRAYGASVRLLSDKFQERTGRIVRKTLVHAAIHEWLDENCRKCIGRGITLDKRGIHIECTKCGGTGQHQHTDYERSHMASLSVSSWKKHEKDYEIVLQCIRGDVASHRVGAMRAFGAFEEDPIKV